jgi:predicted metal-dependent hydrolase
LSQAASAATSDETSTGARRARARRPEAAPVARTPRLGFAGVPKRWFAGSAAVSHVANGVNLLFPAGERFFVRSVRHYLAELEDPTLVAQVRGFFGQEGRHAQAHERFFDTLREQGYDIDAFLGPYEALAYDRVEKRAPPALRLAVTVALEHFTAILAEDALTSGELEHAHPTMRQLLEWHAVEELEHKSVAFDVLAATNPGYALRMVGLALATLGLGAFWLKATGALLAKDGLTLRDCGRELDELRAAAQQRGHAPRSILSGVFGRGIREYLRPSFHPSDRDHRALVAQALARLAAEGVLDGMPVESA